MAAVAVAAAAIVLGRLGARDGPPSEGRVPEPRPVSPEPAADAQPARPEARVAPSEAGPARESEARVPSLPRRWRELVRERLGQAIADQGLDDELTERDREELLSALARVRWASRLGQRRSRDHAWQVRQSEALVAADRVFREKLGMGIGEFIAEQSQPSEIVDLGAPVER